MKLRCDRRELAEATAWSAKQLAAKPTVPARAGLLLEAAADSLTVSGVDWDVTTRSSLPADVGEPGRIVVPGRLAASVLATFPGEYIDLTLDGQQAVLASGDASFTLSLLPAEDYPALMARPRPAGTVDGSLFADAVGQIIGASDPTVAAKPWMGAVHVATDGEQMTLTATDSYRLAERTLTWRPADGAADLDALMPGQALLDAAKAMAGGEVLLSGDLPAGLGTATRYASLALVDRTGRPDVHKNIPRFTTTGTVEVAPLIAAIRRACLVATDRKPKILVGFKGTEVSVRAAGDTGAVARDTLPADLLDGDPMQIAFKPEYLLEGLQHITADAVRFELHSPTRPARLQAATGDADYQYLVMPVRL
ncbi:DNA polymerase III subunit beta [Streptomyces sp. Ac-502]|uniref:DNA polymerase III subunit beta n=1 Tax=Streptomyces sp. Ac-502 TaxID=3342801 RepID=UPI00386293CC